jgi:hypothetical protein
MKEVKAHIGLIRRIRRVRGVYSLKIPERYEKYLRVSSSVKGKSLSTHPRGRDWATSQTPNLGGDRMNPRIRILPISSANSPFGERKNGQRSGKLFFKADAPKVSQKHEYMERKRVYYHIIVFPGRI